MYIYLWKHLGKSQIYFLIEFWINRALFFFHSNHTTTQKNVLLSWHEYILLICILVISNWRSFWKIANRKILLSLQRYMLIQHIHSFTYSCKHGNHVRRTRNNAKRHSFWRLPALLLCVTPLQTPVLKF